MAGNLSEMAVRTETRDLRGRIENSEHRENRDGLREVRVGRREMSNAKVSVAVKGVGLGTLSKFFGEKLENTLKNWHPMEIFESKNGISAHEIIARPMSAHSTTFLLSLQ